MADTLDDLARRGMVFRTKRGETLEYRLPDARFVFLRGYFWPGTEDEKTKAVARSVNRYYRDGFGDNWKHVHTKGLRAIPINQTIGDPRKILPYEDVIRFLDNQEIIAVANCACRHRKSLDSEEPQCQHEKENCLHFDTFARYLVDNGLGREISREEAGEILTRAAEAGLVHGISNWQNGVDTICNCCKCCCVYLEAFHVLKHAKGMNHSNYEVETNHSTCSGCGLCVKRCPMRALNLEQSPDARNKKGKAPVLTPGVCIGCGVCVYKCPTGSITLIPRPEPDHPPTDRAEHRQRFLEERRAALGESDD
ncbi:ATP-binding protein [Thermodesulfobacteriota bacterium]